MNYRLIIIGLGAVATLGLTTGCTKNVRFAYTPVPPVPFVAPHTNRFGVNFKVLNRSNNNYAPNAFKVDVQAIYATVHQSSCQRNHDIDVSSAMPADTGQFQVSTFDFDEPSYDPSTSCWCGKSTQCEGVLFLELQRANGQRAPGRYTKFSITWKKSGELADMTLKELD